MEREGAEWWGGHLADGSLVVLSPSGRALFVSDSSSPSGLQPGVGKNKASSFKEWAGTRTGVPFPYGRGGHTIGVRRGTVVLVVVLLVIAVTLVNWLVESALHSSPTTLLGGGVTLVAGLGVCVVLSVLVHVIEVAPLKRRGVQFLDMEEDNDEYLRYVHPAVSSTDEWGGLSRMAREYSPPSEQASVIHSLLWEAAGIKPTLDAGEILPGDQSRLSEIALFARGL